jgi:hypothetical protein
MKLWPRRGAKPATSKTSPIQGLPKAPARAYTLLIPPNTDLVAMLDPQWLDHEMSIGLLPGQVLHWAMDHLESSGLSLATLEADIKHLVDACLGQVPWPYPSVFQNRIVDAVMEGIALGLFENASSEVRDGQVHPSIRNAVCLGRQAYKDDPELADSSRMMVMDKAREGGYFWTRRPGPLREVFAQCNFA